MHHFIGRTPPTTTTTHTSHEWSTHTPHAPTPPAIHTLLYTQRAQPQPLIWIISGSCHTPRSTRDSLLTCHHRRRAHSFCLKWEKGGHQSKMSTHYIYIHPLHTTPTSGQARTTAWLRVRIDVVFSCQEVQRCPMVVYHQCCCCRALTVGPLSHHSHTHSHTHSLSAMVGPQGDRCASAAPSGIVRNGLHAFLSPLSSHWTRTHRQ